MEKYKNEILLFGPQSEDETLWEAAVWLKQVLQEFDSLFFNGEGKFNTWRNKEYDVYSEDFVKVVLKEWMRYSPKVSIKFTPETKLLLPMSFHFYVNEEYNISLSFGNTTGSCIVSVESYKETNDRQFIDMLKFFIMKFEPEWGGIQNYEFWSKIAHQDAYTDYRVGWVQYFPYPIIVPAQILENYRWEEIEGKGILVRLTEEEFSCSNPDHIKKGLEMVKLYNELEFKRK